MALHAINSIGNEQSGHSAVRDVPLFLCNGDTNYKCHAIIQSPIKSGQSNSSFL